MGFYAQKEEMVVDLHARGLKEMMASNQEIKNEDRTTSWVQQYDTRSTRSYRSTESLNWEEDDQTTFLEGESNGAKQQKD